MSTALTDLLIELSDPVLRRQYLADPEEYIKSKGLTEEDVLAFRSGDVRKVRWQAASAGYDERRNMFIQFKQGNSPESFHIAELHIELHIEHSDLVAVDNYKLVFEDRDGNLYRGKRRPASQSEDIQ